MRCCFTRRESLDADDRLDHQSPAESLRGAARRDATQESGSGGVPPFDLRDHVAELMDI